MFSNELLLIKFYAKQLENIMIKEKYYDNNIILL